MYKKLTDDQISILIDCGIEEFAHKGYSGANLSAIAKRAGVSVGVIYKYYEDKEALFLACVRHSLQALSDILRDISVDEKNLEQSLRGVIRALIAHAKSSPATIRMYHEITSSGSEEFSALMAAEIEGLSSTVYKSLIKKAKDEERCREDIDPSSFAFFFDNLFMMLQFSYSCEYYKERMRLYLGDDADKDDEYMEDQLIKLFVGSLGLRK